MQYTKTYEIQYDIMQYTMTYEIHHAISTIIQY